MHKLSYFREYTIMLTSDSQATMGKLSSVPLMNWPMRDEYNSLSKRLYQDIEVQVTTLTNTTSEFEQLSIQQRQCYFSYEKTLDFFPHYSESNCVLECSWKKAASNCSCVPWFLTSLFPGIQVCHKFQNRFANILKDF